MQKKDQNSTSSWNIRTILIILFVIVLLYYYSQSTNSNILPVIQSGGTVKNLKDISKILKMF